MDFTVWIGLSVQTIAYRVLCLNVVLWFGYIVMYVVINVRDGIISSYQGRMCGADGKNTFRAVSEPVDTEHRSGPIQSAIILSYEQ